jgi:hypothetical protein
MGTCTESQLDAFSKAASNMRYTILDVPPWWEAVALGFQVGGQVRTRSEKPFRALRVSLEVMDLCDVSDGLHDAYVICVYGYCIHS